MKYFKLLLVCLSLQAANMATTVGTVHFTIVTTTLLVTFAAIPASQSATASPCLVPHLSSTVYHVYVSRQEIV